VGYRRGAYTVLYGDIKLEDPGVDRRIILKWIFRKRVGDLDWINLAQDRDRLRPLLNTLMSLLVPLNVGEFLTR
jgi:hypothetical protein